MKTKTSIIPAVLLIFYCMVGISGCNSKAKEKEAVSAAMESINSALTKGDMGAFELELESIDVTETPDGFRSAFLDLKSSVHDYNVSPDQFKMEKGKKFDAIAFSRWHEKKMAPVMKSFRFLELKAADSVPEIKKRLAKQAEFQNEINERLKQLSK